VKLLLDENLPHQLRSDLPGHDVYTVAFMNWAGIENGELLRRAAADGFDALITNDRGLEYEQNLSLLPVAVVVLLAKANTLEAIRLLCPELLASLSRLRPREFVKLSAP
jgi:predicted nuclease of predicted toxin-antitoxin system